MQGTTTKEFFEYIYGQDALERCNGFIGITLLPKTNDGGGPTHRFKNLEHAADFAQQKSKNYSVYYNLALHKADIGTSKRGTWENAAAHFGLYFDIDVKNDVSAHKKENLVPDVETALAMFREAFVGMKPSYVVDSGFGVHIYCLMHDIIVFREAIDVYNHQLALERAHQRMREVMDKHGYALDSVQDITRILRPVGTINHKGGGQKAVTVIRRSAERYTMNEWMKHCPKNEELNGEMPTLTKIEKAILMFGTTEENQAHLLATQEVENKLKKKKATSKGRAAQQLEEEEAARAEAKREARRGPRAIMTEVKIDLNVERPTELINAMIASSNAFARDFGRKDLATRKDSSPSSYDMSIANACKNAGLSDQETADIIVVFHREHYSTTNRDWGKKLLRPDYIPNTITRAKRQFQSVKAQSTLAAAPIDKTIDPEKIKENIEIISEALGVDIEEIVKYQGDASQYDLITREFGTVRVPSTEKLITYRHFKTILADRTGVIIPPMKAEKWEPIAQAILNTATVRKVHGIDSCAIVADYVRASFARANNVDAWKTAHINKTPFIKESRYFVFCESLFDMMRLDGRIMSMAEVAAALMRIGCSNTKRNFIGANEARQQAWVWRVPKEIVNGNYFDDLQEVEESDEETD